MLRVVDVDPVAQEADLAPLTNNDDARLIQHWRAPERTVRTHQPDAVERRLGIALVRRQSLKQADHASGSRIRGVRHGSLLSLAIVAILVPAIRARHPE
ncbi:hypothetical protein D3C72_2106550 [compost metagenome]